MTSMMMKTTPRWFLVGTILCGMHMPSLRGFAVPQARRPQALIFKHLFRHYDDVSFDSWLRCADPVEFLESVGYSKAEIQDLVRACPNVESMNVHNQLAPRIRFLVETLGGGTGVLDWHESDNHEDHQSLHDDDDDDDDPCAIQQSPDNVETIHTMRLSERAKQVVPRDLFTLNLDRSVAPKHAYLCYHDLAHGTDLLDDPNLLNQFFGACANAESFCQLCNEWSKDRKDVTKKAAHSVADIDQFCQVFGRGLLPACQSSSNDNDDRLVPIMLQHGANHLEHDKFGISALQWASGSGQVQAVQSLLEAHRSAYDSYAQLVLDLRNPKDGATVLHWACAGISPPQIGTGGSYNVCQVLLQTVRDEDASGEEELKEIVNARTYEGRTPAMWAAWSNSVPMLDLLQLHGANLEGVDDQEKSAAHFAAAAGHVEALEYLHQQQGMDLLNRPDQTGRTPLDYAQLFDRTNVVEYLEDLILDHQSSTKVATPQKGVRA